MAEIPVNVLHLDAGTEWRGGQQQVAYLLDGLQQRGISSALACPPLAPLVRTGAQLHLPLLPLPFRSEFDFKTARRIADFARRHRVQILHAHCAHSLSIALLAKIRVRSVKIVAARRVDFHVKKPALGAFKYSNAWVNRIVTVSDAIRDILIEDGVDAEKITTVHSGVDVQRFAGMDAGAVRRDWEIPDSHILIGTVAALADHKDYPTLLRAARIVLDQRKDVSFLAVGDGPEREPVTALAESLNLGRHFQFAGFAENVGEFLHAFDIFVMASKTEGLGTSIIDAQAVGCPIAATKAGGIPELIRDGETGLLAPPRQPKALAETLLTLIDQPELRYRLGRAAQKQARQFSVDRMVEKTISVYNELSAFNDRLR